MPPVAVKWNPKMWGLIMVIALAPVPTTATVLPVSGSMIQGFGYCRVTHAKARARPDDRDRFSWV
jgi:hypothetical protein